jgi:hypothetical protein
LSYNLFLLYAPSPMPTASSERRTTTITVDLGDLKTPWQAWCQDHGVTPSHALRNAIRQAMDRKATQAPAPRLRVNRRRERATARMKLNVTPSELAALRTYARHEGYDCTRLAVSMTGIPPAVTFRLDVGLTTSIRQRSSRSLCVSCGTCLLLSRDAVA